jgi:serine/threonine protein kinase
VPRNNNLRRKTELQLPNKNAGGGLAARTKMGAAPARRMTMGAGLGLNLGLGTTLDIISNRGKLLEEQFKESKKFNFDEKFVRGEKLGEGQHSTVWSCHERTVPRSNDDCTPLLAKDISKDDYKPEKYAVKIVRDDDCEKLRAHEVEFEILSKLKHPNIVNTKEIFVDNFKNIIYQVIEFIDGSEILDEIASSGAYTERDT